MNVELDEIKKCLLILKKHHDITYYGLEADVVNILTLLAKHKYNDEFKNVCHYIKNTPKPNESYRDSIEYLLSYIDKNKYNNKLIWMFDDWHIDTLKKYR